MNNIKIIVSSPPPTIPSEFQDSDGTFSFDLFEDTDFAVTKQIDEATEVGSIRQDTVQNIQIPITRKNRILLDNLGNVQAFNKLHAAPFSVKVIVGDIVLPERSARLVSASDESGFELEISGDLFGWIKPLQDLYLKDVDFGTFDFTEANVFFAQEFEFIYQDGGTIVNFPLCNYGKFPLGNKVQVEDFRPWFSVLGILQAIFCFIGWKFRAPILESETYGRRLWAYLLKPNFRDASIDLTNASFIASLSADLDVRSAIGKVVFDDDTTPPNTNPGGYYDATTGFYEKQSVGDYFFSGQLRVQTAGAPSFSVFWVKVDPFNNETIYAQRNYGFTQNGIYDVELNAYNVTLYAGEKIALTIQGIAFNTAKFDLLAGSRIWNVIKSATYSRGDTLILSSLFGENYKAIDLLKGVVHLFNLKPETDAATKTVWFYPENGARDFYADGNIEAYFRTNAAALDWTDKIQCESLSEQIPTNELTKEYEIGFKETTDPGIERLYLAEEMFAKVLQFEEDFKEGRTENRNPFFEPTRNDFDTSIGGEFDSQPWIPFLWDSEPEQGELLPEEPSVNIAPRICLAYGYYTELIDSTAIPSLPGVIFGYYRREDGLIESKVLVFSQAILPGVSLITSTYEEDLAVVYDPQPVRSDIFGNYEYLYKETIRTLYFSIPIDLLVRFRLSDFAKFTHRDKVFFRYFSRAFGELSVFCRVVKIEDYIVNKDLTTPIQFLPSANYFDLNC